MSHHPKGPRPTRRQVLAGAAATLAVPATKGVVQLGLKPKIVVELVRSASTNTMRLVERVRWVTR